MENQRAVNLLAALAQETRLGVFRLLVERGPGGLAAGKIADALDIVPATLTFHLKELERAGLVASRQEGRFVYYAANFAAMNDLIAFLANNCCGGNPCLPAATVSVQSIGRAKVTK
jgi:DNA-binding transcriptional ArsR family regulator